MKPALLFDLDGTLLDTLQDLLDATNYALTLHGYPTRTLAELRAFVGNGAYNQMRLSLPEGTADSVIQDVLATYKPYYTAHCARSTHPYEGILHALETLLHRGYSVGIVSNKPDAAVKALCARYFPGIPAFGETPEIPRKPAPDMVCHAMTALNAGSCIYIGDSEVDILTAANAKVPCVSVLWGFRDKQDLSGAAQYCQTPTDLPTIIDQLCTNIFPQGEGGTAKP